MCREILVGHSNPQILHEDENVAVWKCSAVLQNKSSFSHVMSTSGILGNESKNRCNFVRNANGQLFSASHMSTSPFDVDACVKFQVLLEL